MAGPAATEVVLQHRNLGAGDWLSAITSVICGNRRRPERSIHSDCHRYFRYFRDSIYGMDANRSHYGAWGTGPLFYSYSYIFGFCSPTIIVNSRFVCVIFTWASSNFSLYWPLCYMEYSCRPIRILNYLRLPGGFETLSCTKAGSAGRPSGLAADRDNTKTRCLRLIGESRAGLCPYPPGANPLDLILLKIHGDQRAAGPLRDQGSALALLASPGRSQRGLV